MYAAPGVVPAWGPSSLPKCVAADALARFSGDFRELESALGMYALGHFFGWKSLFLVHSKRTVRKYESILGFRVRDVFQAEGSAISRLACYPEVSSYWRSVSGEVRFSVSRSLVLPEVLRHG